MASASHAQGALVPPPALQPLSSPDEPFGVVGSGLAKVPVRGIGSRLRFGSAMTSWSLAEGPMRSNASSAVSTSSRFTVSGGPLSPRIWISVTGGYVSGSSSAGGSQPPHWLKVPS